VSATDPLTSAAVALLLAVVSPPACSVRGPEGRELEVGRHDADDGVRLAVEQDLLPDRVPVAPETPLPEAVAEDYDALVPRPVLAGGVRATERRVHPEHL
jgi:hypothetical protein